MDFFKYKTDEGVPAVRRVIGCSVHYRGFSALRRHGRDPIPDRTVVQPIADGDGHRLNQRFLRNLWFDFTERPFGLIISFAFYSAAGVGDVVSFLAGIVYGVIIELVSHRYGN